MHEDPPPPGFRNNIHSFSSNHPVSLIAGGMFIVSLAVLAATQFPSHKRSYGSGENTTINNDSTPNSIDPIGEATITSGELEQLVPSDIAIERLTYVTCTHQSTCAASDEALTSEEECSRQTRMGLTANLDEATVCAKGVEPKQLERCVAAIERSGCGASMAAETDMVCRASALCPPMR